jgi:polygalacturonase
MKTGIAALMVLCLTLAVTVRGDTPPLPVIPNQTFIVTSFGAVGDGAFNNATAIQNTINAAAAAGGGIVEVPGGAYLSGPFTLANNINLKIDSGATLKMLPRSNWPGTTTFISGSNLHDVEISGAGTIDGNAGVGLTDWWQTPSLSTAARPYFISINGCLRVLIQDVTLQNPPKFHLLLKGGDVSLTVRNIIIKTPSDPSIPVAEAHNTDGIDLGATNVLIQGCSISTGDDNIQIGSSGAVCADITITNCQFGNGHGVSPGGQKGVHDLVMSNCTFNGTEYGIHMKSDRSDGGLVENLKFLDLTMMNVNFPIAIYSYYDLIGTPKTKIDINPSTAAADSPQASPTTPIWRNITISNVTATAVGGNIAGIIWGLPEMPVSNVSLQNVTISAPDKTFCIYNAKDIQIIDSNLTAPNTTTNTLTLYNAEVIVTNSSPNPALITLGGLATPQGPNALAFFNAHGAISENDMLGSGPITLGQSTLTFSQNSVDSFNSPITVATAGTLVFNAGNNTLNGVLSGDGPLTLDLPTSSVLTLQSDSSGFTGPVVVSGKGTLLVDNTAGSGTGAGNVTVASGATLGGSGAIGGQLTVDGALAPGNGPGTLTINNNLVINGDAALQYELGASSDLTVVKGNLTLGGTLNITDAGGFTDGTYTLFIYTGALTDKGLFVGTTPGAHKYAIDKSTAGVVKLTVTKYTPHLPKIWLWNFWWWLWHDPGPGSRILVAVLAVAGVFAVILWRGRR